MNIPTYDEVLRHAASALQDGPLEHTGWEQLITLVDDALVMAGIPDLLARLGEHEADATIRESARGYAGKMEEASHQECGSCNGTTNLIHPAPTCQECYIRLARKFI